MARSGAPAASFTPFAPASDARRSRARSDTLAVKLHFPPRGFARMASHVLGHFGASVGWRTLATRTAGKMSRDDAFSLAAELAYYFFLSLFPALLCLLALAGLFPLQNFTDDVVRLLAPVAPTELIAIVRDQMLKLADGDHGGLVSLGLIGALWSSSTALVAVIDALNRAYEITEARSWWRIRLAAIGLTIGLGVFIIVSLTLVVAGPALAKTLAGYFGLSAAFVWTWTIVQWPVVVILVATGIGLVYYFAPDAEQDWVWITPGSVLATALWLAGSLGLRYYVVHFGRYEAAYGTVGGVIVALLWFYLTGLVIVMGAELNAEIEHASPWGKAPREKVPGERRKIGAAAARAYHALRATHDG